MSVYGNIPYNALLLQSDRDRKSTDLVLTGATSELKVRLRRPPLPSQILLRLSQ